jgi:ketosteroid isomerase-like protein
MTRQPVSPDIKAFVDQGFSCWNSGDIDLMADSYADDAEVDTTTALPDGRRYKGHGKVARVQMFPSRDAALEAAGLPK